MDSDNPFDEVESSAPEKRELRIAVLGGGTDAQMIAILVAQELAIRHRERGRDNLLAIVNLASPLPRIILHEGGDLGAGIADQMVSRSVRDEALLSLSLLGGRVEPMPRESWKEDKLGSQVNKFARLAKKSPSVLRRFARKRK